jgi:ATP-dependent DNA helicase RecG
VRRFAGNSGPADDDLRAAPLHPPRPSALEAPLTTLPGVGPKLAEAADEAGISTLGDLLLRFPHSHRDRTVVPVAEVEPGEQATIQVEVQGNAPRPFRRRGLSVTSVKVGDDSGSVRATWFNQPWVAQKLTPGSRLLLTGSRDSRGFRVSEHELLPSGPRVLSQGEGGAAGRAVLDPPPPAPSAGGDSRRLVPVHPATQQLKPQRIRQWVERAIGLAPNAIEPLPAGLRSRRGLAGVADAITAAHFPEGEAEVEASRERLAFEELFLYQAVLATRNRAHRVARPAPRLGEPGELVERWIGSLPFEPTADQLAAIEEIDADLESGEPMSRLLMGEVGSGKTVVALYAMLRALEAGYQGVLMAPTETLAEQHAATLDRLLGPEAIPFGLLTGATPAARRREGTERLATGELGLAVGTHALIDPSIRFSRLGVCVVDEQHRFGVEQRRALDAKGAEGLAPHVLHMTATPIPRTLSLTAYGDLDMTALRELPSGRRPVETRLIDEGGRPTAFELVREQLRAGRQAFVVCPLVVESEKQQGKAAEREAERLAGGELRGFEVEVLHGQMPSAEKAAVMERFVRGATEVLVSTTVVEVGIDVPNATVMVIEGAERYGVSQLHQLRGRVGRGAHHSYCLLIPEDTGAMARRRLRAVAAENDGFKLAEVDLALRGEGEVLGTRQHGLPRFAAAELPEDMPVLLEAREEVLALLREHGSLDAPALGPLMDAANRRFGTASTDPIPL